MGKLFFACLMVLAAIPAAAADLSQTEIVFDASRSMNEPASSGTRLDEAKKALRELAGQIAPGSNVGLRIFGQTPVRGNVKESCFDSKLVIPIQPYQTQLLLDQTAGLAANGQTALGYSLELAAKDFHPQAQKSIILISDGEESCGKDPVAVIKNLQAQGINVKVHAVGFAVDSKTKAQLQQIAQITGGTYQDASSAADLAKSLKAAGEKENIIEGKLLKAGRNTSSENLLAASAGTKIISATHEDMAEMIDGTEDQVSLLTQGDVAVFAFKENQPVLLEAFAVPVPEENSQNGAELFLSGSVDSAEAGFFPIATIHPKNQVDFKNINQEFKIDPPAAIRYLRIQAGKSAESGGSSIYYEWKILGKYLNEEEFAAAVKKQKPAEQNLIGKESGGQMIASSDPSFSAFIDGIGEDPAEAASVEGGQEAIFGFLNGKGAVLTKASIPVFETSQYTCKTFEISVSRGNASGPFEPAGTFATQNMVFAGNPYQDFVFPSPAYAKFVKVKILDGHEDAFCELPEIRIYGTFSEKEPPAAEPSVQKAALSAAPASPTEEQVKEPETRESESADQELPAETDKEHSGPVEEYPERELEEGSAA